MSDHAMIYFCLQWSSDAHFLLSLNTQDSSRPKNWLIKQCLFYQFLSVEHLTQSGALWKDFFAWLTLGCQLWLWHTCLPNHLAQPTWPMLPCFQTCLGKNLTRSHSPVTEEMEKTKNSTFSFLTQRRNLLTVRLSRHVFQYTPITKLSCTGLCWNGGYSLWVNYTVMTFPLVLFFQRASIMCLLQEFKHEGLTLKYSTGCVHISSFKIL